MSKSFNDVFRDMLDRFEWESYSGSPIAPEYLELVKIITSVYALPPYERVRINGRDFEAGAVQEIYDTLTESHLEEVIYKFRNIDFKVRNPESYLRSMLYHETFQLELSMANDIAVNERGAG